jgi:AhpD family alkylhydroperoxidase
MSLDNLPYDKNVQDEDYNNLHCATRESTMKKLILASAMIMSFTGVAYAADPPDWMKQITPPKELPFAWQEFQTIFTDGALPEKTKELIGLGVAAQIPCQYCILAHTRMAKAAGATDAEIKEAIAASALVRKWSTMLNGNQVDMVAFEKTLPPVGKPTN